MTQHPAIGAGSVENDRAGASMGARRSVSPGLGSRTRRLGIVTVFLGTLLASPWPATAQQETAGEGEPDPLALLLATVEEEPESSEPQDSERLSVETFRHLALPAALAHQAALVRDLLEEVEDERDRVLGRDLDGVREVVVLEAPGREALVKAADGV